MAFLQILGYLGLGLALQRLPRCKDVLLPWLIQGLLWICFPALGIYRLPQLQLTGQALLPVLLIWLCLGGALLWALLWQKRLQLDRASLVCLVLTMGLGNTSFVGFPLLHALIGPEALPPAILMDLAGSFLAASTLGIFLLTWATGERLQPLEILQRLLTFPPLLALLVSSAMWLGGWQLQGGVAQTAEFLGSLLPPLALLSVGMQLDLKPDPALRRLLSLGLVYKLGLAPLGVWLLASALKLEPALLQVCVLEAGMGPMITAALMTSAEGKHRQILLHMLRTGGPC